MEMVVERCALSPAETEHKNSEFTPVKIRIAYVGKNRNNRCISKETMDAMIPSLYNIPIVGHWKEDVGNFGEHDLELVKSGNKIEVKDLTKPYGVVPADAEVWYEDVTEEDGAVHTYLCCTGLLWTARYPEVAKLTTEPSNQSMEIRVYEKTDWENGTGYDITKAEFSALCILGRSDNAEENMTPCFESASIEAYSTDSFKAEFAAMMDELHKEDTPASEPTPESEPEPEPASEPVQSEAEKFSATIEERRKKFFDALDRRDRERHHYYFVDADSQYVYADHFYWNDNGRYDETVRIPYIEADDKVVLAEQEEKVLCRWLTPAEAEAVENERAAAQSELEQLRTYRAKREADDVFANFSDLATNEEFAALKGEYEKYDVEMLRTLCFAIRGKNAPVKTDAPIPKIPVVGNPADDEDDPYGGIIKPLNH